MAPLTCEGIGICGGGAESRAEPGGELAGRPLGRGGVANDASLADRLATKLELRFEKRHEIGAAGGDQHAPRRA